ncbi:MAG: SpoIIE family protein phosphatase [Chlorobi bacterium]|nr:SpoIIE family protein phosphatase [Chlorobiota bacterium]
MNIINVPENLRSNTIADGITAVAKGDKNNLAMGTNGVGVIWENLKTGAVKNFKSLKNKKSISSNTITALAVDKDNNLWIGSSLGLDKLNPKNEKLNKYYTDIPAKYRAFSINDLQFDKAGRLFVAYTGGVDILYPNQNYIKKIPTVYNRKYSDELQSEIIDLAYSLKPISSILKVGEQKTLVKEFELINDTEVLAIGVGEGQPNLDIMFDYGWLEDEAGNVVWTMHKFFDSFYFQGGFKNRIIAKTLKLRKGKYKLKFQSDVGHSYGSFNVVSPTDSSLWGIQVIKLNDKLYSELSKKIDDEIENSSKMLMDDAQSIFVSKLYENILWIGTLSQGLLKYNLSNGKFKRYNKITESAAADFVISNDVYFVLEDSKGFVWFSSPNGLGKLNPKTEKIKYFTEKDGLPTNMIGTIQEDNYGNLWISSAAGLTTLVRNNEGEKETFINIDIKDGLQGYSYSRATWKSENGELYFGGVNGVNYFRPGRTNQTKPKIVITDFRLSDVSVFDDSSNSLLKKELNETEELKLNYTQNDIAFKFSPIHYSRPERNLIAYKLEGFNKDWVYSKLKFASFTNLDPGEYVFKLKAANGDGFWSEDEKAIKIEIAPPYWKTTFAYILYGLLIISGIFGIDKFQRRRLLAKAKEKMKIQEAELRAVTAEAQAKVMQAENDRKTKELEEARQLQLSMLPKGLPDIPNLDIAVYMETATEVGGDYYDYHIHSDKTFTIVLGDATGHGMQAGMMVSIIKSLFMSDRANKELLPFYTNTNSAIKDMRLGRLMMALTAVQFDGKMIKTINAGMPPVLLYDSRKQVVRELTAKSMPLGAMKNFPYSLEESELNAGDTIMLFSDGLPELLNEANQMYGYEKVKKLYGEMAEKSSEEIVNRFKHSALDWAGGKPPNDDVTFVALKIK